MTDLDRKIAEAKGMKDPDKLEGLEVMAILGGDYSWSTSDSKALELVDELRKEMGCGFYLIRQLEPESAAAARSWTEGWEARFEFRTQGIRTWTHAAIEPTRPEAICQAYLAAVEWMKARKG